MISTGGFFKKTAYENQFSMTVFLRNRLWKCTISTSSFLKKTASEN